MAERWGRLGRHEGEFPSFVQEQLKGSQEVASWEGVACDGEPVQMWRGRVQGQTNSWSDCSLANIFIFSLLFS